MLQRLLPHFSRLPCVISESPDPKPTSFPPRCPQAEWKADASPSSREASGALSLQGRFLWQQPRVVLSSCPPPTPVFLMQTLASLAEPLLPPPPMSEIPRGKTDPLCPYQPAMKHKGNICRSPRQAGNPAA
uniref:Uncharacterized protein n=1 Tax=Naja naja TaxID=35670 RepID=A0A8C6XUY0_NAJNA